LRKNDAWPSARMTMYGISKSWMIAFSENTGNAFALVTDALVLAIAGLTAIAVVVCALSGAVIAIYWQWMNS